MIRSAGRPWVVRPPTTATRIAPAMPTPVAMPTSRDVARIPEAIPFRPAGVAPSMALLLGVTKIATPTPVTVKEIATR